MYTNAFFLNNIIYYVCVSWLLLSDTMGKDDEISIPFAVVRPSSAVAAAAAATDPCGGVAFPPPVETRPRRGVHRGIRGPRRSRSPSAALVRSATQTGSANNAERVQHPRRVFYTQPPYFFKIFFCPRRRAIINARDV